MTHVKSYRSSYSGAYLQGMQCYNGEHRVRKYLILDIIKFYYISFEYNILEKLENGVYNDRVHSESYG